MFFDDLKSPNCVLINQQTTILVIIGAQLMQSFNRNSPSGQLKTDERVHVDAISSKVVKIKSQNENESTLGHYNAAIAIIHTHTPSSQDQQE